MTPPTITLAGKRYEYRPSLTAYQRFHELTGIDVADLQAMRSAADPFDTMIKLIWCVLSHHHRELSLEFVRSTLSLEAMLEFLGTAGQSLQQASSGHSGVN